MWWKNFSVFSLGTKKCEKWVENSPFFQIHAILECVFQKWKQLRFSEENIKSTRKKTQFCMWQLQFSWNKGKREQAVDHYCALIKGCVNPEIVKNIACCNFLIITVIYIKVYISGMEMSQRIHFLYQISLKMLIFFEKMAKNHFFGKKKFVTS